MVEVAVSTAVALVVTPAGIFTTEALEGFAVAEGSGTSTAPEGSAAFAAAKVLAALITEASEAFVVAEGSAVFAATASLVASAGTRSSLISISDLASGPTGVRSLIGTDMARGGGLTPITLLTTTLIILTTLHLIAILGMIVVIGTIAAVRTIAIPTTGATTVPPTLPSQTARILTQGLQIRLVRKALLSGIT